MTLTTIGGVACEQARIYRACLNGKLKPSDMCRMMFGLREIRVSLESIPPEPAAKDQPVTTVRIIDVPRDHFIRHVDELSSNSPLTIDHIVHDSSLENFDSAQTIEPPIEADMPIETTIEPFIEPARAYQVERLREAEPEPADDGGVYLVRSRSLRRRRGPFND